jgi:C4-type Zn-finger protein
MRWRSGGDKKMDNLKQCPFCGKTVLEGQSVVSIPLSNGDSLEVLATVAYCAECYEYCEIETELV